LIETFANKKAFLGSGTGSLIFLHLSGITSKSGFFKKRKTLSRVHRVVHDGVDLGGEVYFGGCCPNGC